MSPLDQVVKACGFQHFLFFFLSYSIVNLFIFGCAMRHMRALVPHPRLADLLALGD